MIFLTIFLPSDCFIFPQRLFRVYAHIYLAHFSEVICLQEEAHLNTSFKHFVYFTKEFNLIDKKEFSPLSELMEKLVLNDRLKAAAKAELAATIDESVA